MMMSALYLVVFLYR